MMFPYNSEFSAEDQNVIPCPVSWTTQLMAFVPGADKLMPSARQYVHGFVSVRTVLVFVTSKPQYHVYPPLVCIRTVPPPPDVAGFTFPSSVARSPGYCRTMIGRLDVPVRVLVKAPVY